MKMHVSYKFIRLDEDANESKDYVVSNSCVVNIFVEHNVDETTGLIDFPNGGYLEGKRCYDLL
jgi:hypothetical protein